MENKLKLALVFIFFIPLFLTLSACTEKYTIEFDKQSDDIGGADSVIVTGDGKLPWASAPKKINFVFLGYYDDPTEGVMYYNSAMKGVRLWDKKQSGVLYARWYSEGLVFTPIDGGYSVSASKHEKVFLPADVFIPNEYNQKPVIKIADDAFNQRMFLRSVTIPRNVEIIGEKAFYLCNRLTDVIFESGSILTSIGNSAFESCSILPSMVLPEKVVSIGERAFYWCMDLKYVIAPKGLTIIGDRAFYYCSTLTNFMIEEDNGLVSIGEGAFAWCMQLRNFAIPSGVSVISNYAFFECCELENVIIKKGVMTIGEGAFEKCLKLTNLTIPSTVTTIGNTAFLNCNQLENVTFAEHSQLKTIGDSAFAYCAIEDIIIPNGVEDINEYVFSNCTNLKSITIPRSVKNIKGNAFTQCSEMTQMVFEGIPPQIDGSLIIPAKTLIFVLPIATEAYKMVWKDYSDKIYPIVAGENHIR